MAAGTVMRCERKSLQKIAFSVIFERKSSNIQASLIYSNVFYILRLFSFGMKDWRLLLMTWERSGGWFWNRWGLNFVNLSFFLFFEVALYISDDYRHHYISHLLLSFG